MHVDDNTYYVSEIFESIQGEGNYAGVNALFIRFQLCNHTCTWCDTKYTWTKFSGESKKLSKESILSKISESNKEHVILTGGEPALYRLDLLACSNKKYHIETNGTIIPVTPYKTELKDGSTIERKGMSKEVISEFNWVVSPKLANSKQKLNPEALQYWAQQPFAIFKFIIDQESDLEEVEEIMNDFNISREKIYAGLQGVTLESQLNSMLVNSIIKRGFHFSPRLHVLFWGQERGK